MKLNCVITDDEPIAREIIEDHIKMLPDLNLVAKCSNAIETFAALRQFEVNLLFIDIQMPEINGLELIRSLKKTPLLVFITAYPAFAIDGFELDAVDYLLKPVSPDRFLKAMDKVYSRLQSGKNFNDRDPVILKKPQDFFFIKSDTGLTRIDHNKILYIEGLENYIKIVCEDKTVIALNTMKGIENELKSDHFIRIHRSYIVNMTKVEKVRDYLFILKDKELLTGKSYRKGIQNILRRKFSIE